MNAGLPFSACGWPVHAVLSFAFVCGAVHAGDGTDASVKERAPLMKIRFNTHGTVVATATLDDTDSARDFARLLPMSLALEDYAATEKIADLPKRLSTAGAPEGYRPLAGDIAFYAPWGNLAIFHKNFAYSSGLVRLGRLDSGLDLLREPGALSVRIEQAPP